MSDDLDADEFARLWMEAKRPEKDHVETRRKKEARAMSGLTAKRARRRETKTLQINIRVTPSFKKKLASLATSYGVAISDLLEMGVEALEGQNQ